MRGLLPFAWTGVLAALVSTASVAAALTLPPLGQVADEPGAERAANPRNAIHAQADRGLVRLESPRFT